MTTQTPRPSAPRARSSRSGGDSNHRTPLYREMRHLLTALRRLRWTVYEFTQHDVTEVLVAWRKAGLPPVDPEGEGEDDAVALMLADAQSGTADANGFLWVVDQLITTLEMRVGSASGRTSR
jgi:hypothetical protein